MLMSSLTVDFLKLFMYIGGYSVKRKAVEAKRGAPLFNFLFLQTTK